MRTRNDATQLSHTIAKQPGTIDDQSGPKSPSGVPNHPTPITRGCGPLACRFAPFPPVIESTPRISAEADRVDDARRRDLDARETAHVRLNFLRLFGRKPLNGEPVIDAALKQLSSNGSSDAVVATITFPQTSC